MSFAALRAPIPPTAAPSASTSRFSAPPPMPEWAISWDSSEFCWAEAYCETPALAGNCP
ncbi:hypothetical protein [Streptomyces sp. NPDC088923]|uniref:hypothetical protein n=1 Tax=Streptomyces sp. NPDC088923 TaxID=3365913 RepID=UPI00381DE1F4